MIETVLASLGKDAWQQAQSTLAREACLSLAASFLLGVGHTGMGCLPGTLRLQLLQRSR